MVRAIRVPFKSGVLPRPRRPVPEALTTPEREQLAKVRVGFSDPGMAPRGSNPNPPPRVPKAAAQKIEQTARAPSAGADRRRPAWRQEMADVRRRYYESSLRAMEAREQRRATSREQRQAASAAKDFSDPMSETISAAVLHEKVLQRTPEEDEALRLKRQHNRLLTEKRVLTAKADAFLRLYQQSSTFIVSEEQLEARIAAQFVPPTHIPSTAPCESMAPRWASLLRSRGAGTVKQDYADDLKLMALKEAVDGSVAVVSRSNMRTSTRYLPGLGAVRAALRKSQEQAAGSSGTETQS